MFWHLFSYHKTYHIYLFSYIKKKKQQLLTKKKKKTKKKSGEFSFLFSFFFLIFMNILFVSLIRFKSNWLELNYEVIIWMQPQVGREYPLNLSISLSGGKKTN